MKFLILLLFLSLLLCLVMGGVLNGSKRWRRCIKCDHWFSDGGDRASMFPPIGSNIDPDGVCEECINDSDFRR